MGGGGGGGLGRPAAGGPSPPPPPSPGFFGGGGPGREAWCPGPAVPGSKQGGWFLLAGDPPTPLLLQVLRIAHLEKKKPKNAAEEKKDHFLV